jgi:hypothetical protein
LERQAIMIWQVKKKDRMSGLLKEMLALAQ